MRRRGLAHRALCLGKAIGQPRHLTFQPVDDLPLRRNGPVQILDGLFLMGHADFKFVNARCIGHDEGNTPADERTQCLVLFCSRLVLTCGSVALRLRGNERQTRAKAKQKPQHNYRRRGVSAEQMGVCESGEDWGAQAVRRRLPTEGIGGGQGVCAL